MIIISGCMLNIISVLESFVLETEFTGKKATQTQCRTLFSDKKRKTVTNNKFLGFDMF